MYRSQLKITTQETAAVGEDNGNKNSIKNDTTLAPIKTLTLRDNQLHGSILIGNYNYLTHLEVSDNELESLDLSSLKKLETLKCNHNRLMELVLSGEHLITVSLQCNNLHTLNVSTIPHKLKYLNLSHNYFMELPYWLSNCTNLQILNVSYNRLQNISDFLASYNINDLEQLNLGFNQLQMLTKFPDKLSTLKELYLQANDLQKLPDNFFDITSAHLSMLNVSANKLNNLPKVPHDAGTINLEQLFLSSNRLTECIFEASLLHASKLRVLHVAYNKIATLPDLCMHKWPELEVLVLSGNMLQHLPAGIGKLNKLEVLRVHSNLLLTTPSLCKLSQLKVLDLAHNHLDHINLVQLVPAQLKYLDLSCNLQLQLDEQELVACQTKRKWSLIDVSGKNRSALPTIKLASHENNAHTTRQKTANAQKPPWIVGFSETPGLNCRKLLISQMRLSNFPGNAGLFGMFESICGNSASQMSAVIRQMSLKLQEQLMKNHQPIIECMKCALQEVCEQLTNTETNSRQQEPRVAAAFCHIFRESMHFNKQQTREARSSGKSSKGTKSKGKHFVLRLVSFGNICAYLVRKTSNICLTATPITCQHDNFEESVTTKECDENQVDNALTNFSSLVESKKIILSNEDEYMIMCNDNLWQYIDIDRVTRELRKEDNMVLAAKRVQNIAQSFGAQDSLSVLVLRFKNLGTDVDHLLREMEIGRSRPTVSCLPALTRKPLSTCCNERLGAERFAGLRSCYTRSERSSPSGQSDHLGASSKVNSLDDGKEFASLAHVEEVVSEEQDILDETDSILSEEQFKCWEYMLEQNTQLLFDKELNTISKAFSAQNNKAKYSFPSSDELHIMDDKLTNKKLLPNNYNYNKLKSASSPHLLYGPVGEAFQTNHLYQQQPFQQNLSFSPKPLGSGKTMRATSPSFGYNYIKTRLQDTLNIGHFVGSSYAKLAGGPNAAYFGSVQRQVPPNFEYDLATVQQECSMLEDDDNFSDEQESRMTKYWGVATTEL